MHNILISVIIPTYKRSNNLIRAIESILCQKGSYEIIVVDDNGLDSEDRKNNEKNLEKYIKNNEIIYIKHEKNLNGATARNTGIENASGKYITFLDDDDEFMPNRLNEIEKCILNRSPDFLCTGVIFKSDGIIQKRSIPIIAKCKSQLILDLLLQKSFIGTGSNIICKSSIVREIGGFDTRFKRHQDMEFMIRVLEKSENLICIDKYLVIKNNDDTINIPSFEKLYQSKSLFLNKFDYIINEYDKNVKKDIYNKNYYELLDIAYLTQNKKDINLSLWLLKEKEIYSIWEVNKIYIKNIFKRNKFLKLIRSQLVK